MAFPKQTKPLEMTAKKKPQTAAAGVRDPGQVTYTEHAGHTNQIFFFLKTFFFL